MRAHAPCLAALGPVAVDGLAPWMAWRCGWLGLPRHAPPRLQVDAFLAEQPGVAMAAVHFRPIGGNVSPPFSLRSLELYA